jgi:tripartite-type tricarboxylate transporter receptor subunit TctC
VRAHASVRKDGKLGLLLINVDGNTNEVVNVTVTNGQLTTSGTRYQFVPYRNTGMQDLMAGLIDLMIDPAANSVPQVRAGTIKAYAVTSRQRTPAAPHVPTVDEAGLPGLQITSWHGLWVPKDTSRDIIAKLNEAVVEALADPTVRRRLADLANETVPREQQTPAALASWQKAEIEKWWPIIKAAGVKAE